MSPEDVVAAAAEIGVHVSRETRDKLAVYEATLQKWQPKINLVSRNTIADAWQAHIWDSLQLMQWVPHGLRTHVDIGSGAGFPGLVLALMGAAEETVLIESDQRKSAFLQEIIRLTDAPARVLARRIEAAPALLPDTVDLVSARALASLDKLLHLACPLGHTDTVYLFPKGQNVDSELTEAAKYWIFSVKRFHGVADARTTVLRISDVSARTPKTP